MKNNNVSSKAISNGNSEDIKNLNPLNLERAPQLLEGKIISNGNNLETDDYSYILILEGKNDHRCIHLEEHLYEIGRRQSAQIRIKDQAISRHHATIIKEYDPDELIFYYKILDGNLSGSKSTNGLVVNNKHYKNKYLEHGDLISFTNDIKARFFVIDKNSINDHLFVNLEKKENEDQQIDENPTKILTNYSQVKQTLTNYVNTKQTLNHNINRHGSRDIFFQKDNIIEYISKISSFAELSPYPIIEINLQGILTYYNPSASLLFPDLEKEGTNHPLLCYLLRAEHKIQGNLFVREVNYKDKIFEQYIHYLPELKLIRSYIFDFTKRKTIESQLKDSEEKYRAVLEQTSEGILLFNADNLHIIEANLSATKILQYPMEEIIGQNIDSFVVNKHIDFLYKLNLLKETQLSFRQELKLKVKYNEPINIELSVNIINYDNNLVFCCVFRDITARKKLENELKYQAYYDNLTGLYKRNYFRDFFAKTLTSSQKEKSSLAIMFLDVDKFKSINDNYGHDIGDLLLKQFAQRLKNCVKKSDCLGRWGGDEFVVLLVDVLSVEQVMLVADRIIKSMASPFVCNNDTIQTSTSIGLAIFPNHGNDVDSLMKKADEALYVTKDNGRNGYTIYHESLMD